MQMKSLSLVWLYLITWAESGRHFRLPRSQNLFGRHLVRWASTEAAGEFCNCDEVLKIAELKWGLSFTESYLGPSYQIVARTRPNAEGDKGQIVGYTTGFMTAPLLRQDTMQIYGVNRGYGRAALEVPAEIAAEEGRTMERVWKSQSVHGLSVLMGYFAARRAYDKGCRRAELLAINDDPKQHELLVRHYQRLRFHVVREVGDDLGSVPDRLAWGGVGTLMEADIEDILEKGTAHLRRYDRTD